MGSRPGLLVEFGGEEGTTRWGPSTQISWRKRVDGGKGPVGGGLGGWVARRCCPLGPALRDSQAAQGVQTGPGRDCLYAGLPAKCELPVSRTFVCFLTYPHVNI